MGTSKLMEAKKSTSTSTSTTVSSETRKSKEPPAGAKIISESVRTETEEIENGWILTKNYDVSYMLGKEKNWTYYTKKWFSKTNPITVTVNVNDKALADQFDE